MQILGPARPARSWLLLSGYVAAIFAFLPFGREVLIALRRQNLLGAAMTALYLLAVVWVVRHVVKDVRLSDAVAFAALVLLSAVTAALLIGLEIPEERIHFLQYGIMAWMARFAFGWHLPAGRTYLAAFGFAAGVGLADEIVQGVLPARVFDVRDVLTNAEAALIGVFADEVIHNRIGWRRHREASPDPR